MLSPLNTLALSGVDERVMLHDFAANLPSNAVIAEVGTFMGGSAAIMAHANPTAKIHCFDLFEDDPHLKYRGDNQYKEFNRLLSELEQFQLFQARLLSGEVTPARSLDNVRLILARYANIQLYKGRSPEAFKTWSTVLDVYFEDSMHSNPSLSKNVRFWEPKVKPHGFVLLHDYRPHLPLDHYHRFIDVEAEHDRLLSMGYTRVSHVGGLVVLKKP